MAVRLIFPEPVASFSIGATLCIVNSWSSHWRYCGCDLLWRVRWVDDDGILRLVIYYQICVVVTAPHPYREQSVTHAGGKPGRP